MYGRASTVIKGGGDANWIPTLAKNARVGQPEKVTWERKRWASLLKWTGVPVS
jgi:hypothetical protein